LAQPLVPVVDAKVETEFLQFPLAFQAPAFKAIVERISHNNDGRLAARQGKKKATRTFSL
jgi:hypothetical protein